MAKLTSDDLRTLAAPIWDAQHSHPFVTGIGDGTLEEDCFRFWVRQDYLFLIDYSRVLALGAARAPDLAAMTKLAELAQSTLAVEMDLHRSYASEFGIATQELEDQPMAPTTRAYTDFLVRVAATGDFAELVAALLPCMWGFSEVGQRLAARGESPEPRYQAWIEMYASEEFAELAAWCRELMDQAGASLSELGRRQVEDAFFTSSRYELAFWEMAMKRERWPI